MSEAVLDLTLAAAIVGLAWIALASRDLFRGVVLYIVFGLLLALAWVRLEAPDIALAEAAIGAGLTGALLLDAVAQLGGPPDDAAGRERAAVVRRALPAAGVLLLAAGLALGVRALPHEPGGLTAPAMARMPESGVEHPVTAVLLNFRAFDTWLEIAVLLVAVLAALILRRAPDLQAVPVPAARDPLLRGLPRLLVPLMLLAGVYLLWRGTHAPGGAFQAGAVLAAAAVLLLLAGRRGIVALRAGPLRLVLLAGFAAFLLAGVGTLAAGARLLELAPAQAGTLIVLIEAAVTLSIAATLAALFAAGRPHATGPAAPRAEPTIPEPR